MRVAAVLVSAFLAVSPLLAFKGKVVREDGKPVADAAVSIIGYAGSVRTDRKGYFSWQPDPAPPFEVLVVLPSGQYLLPVLVEQIPENGPVLIEVPPVIQETVTVRAGAAPNIEAPAGNATTLLAREDLKTRQPNHLIDAVETLPGVSRVSDGNSAVPAIRGLARGRTLVLIDGGRVTTERRVGPGGGYLDPFFLEGLEVARGPGSVAYGSDAFGGVIHARTRRPDLGSPLAFRFEGTLGAGLPERGAGVEVSQGFEKGGFLVGGSFRQFGDYRSPLGDVDNSGARSRSFLTRANHEVGPGQFSVGFQADRARDVGRPRTNSNVQRFFYPGEDSDRFTASYDWDPFGGFSRLTMDFFLGRYRLVTARERIPDETTPRIIEISDVEARDYGFRALAVRPLRNARLEVGVDFNGRFDLKAIEEVRLFDLSGTETSMEESNPIEDARRNDSAVYGSVEWLLAPALTVSGGARFDHLTSRSRGGTFGDQSSADTAVSGFASLTVRPFPSFQATGQVARGFRDAGLSDRYFAGITGRGFIIGNPSLEPESSVQLDLAVRFSIGNTRWNVYAYRYRIDDLIERFEDQEDIFLFRNRDRARIQGVEAEFQWDVKPGLMLTAAAQKSTGETNSDGLPLDDVPVQNLNLSVRKSLLQKGYAQLLVAAYSRDERPGPTERVTPGYVVVDLGGGWPLGERFVLRANVRNLLDKDFPLSPDRRAVTAPGINAAATLELNF